MQFTIIRLTLGFIRFNKQDIYSELNPAHLRVANHLEWSLSLATWHFLIASCQLSPRSMALSSAVNGALSVKWMRYYST